MRIEEEEGQGGNTTHLSSIAGTYLQDVSLFFLIIIGITMIINGTVIINSTNIIAIIIIRTIIVMTVCGAFQTLEVVAEPTAPLLSYEALLEAAPVEVDQEERLELLAERAEAQEIVDVAKKDVSSIPTDLIGFFCCEFLLCFVLAGEVNSM
jgi:hypothetical protein